MIVLVVAEVKMVTLSLRRPFSLSVEHLVFPFCVDLVEAACVMAPRQFPALQPANGYGGRGLRR